MPKLIERPCIRVDGVPFPISDGHGGYLSWLMAAQCDGYEEAFTDDGELTLGPKCLGRLFLLEPLGRGAHYVCERCNEPYTIRLIPLQADRTLSQLIR